MTTEFNTLFETITSISEKVDPVKLNLTLSATARGADRAWATSSASRSSTATRSSTTSTRRCRRSATTSSGWPTWPTSTPTPRPDLWDALDNAVTTARTFNQQRNELDAALLAAAGFGNTGGRHVRARRAVPGARCRRPGAHRPSCWTPTARSCSARCATTPRRTRRWRIPWRQRVFAATPTTTFLGAENPYVYPDNLPRVNARGGPGGAPGCWQTIDRDLAGAVPGDGHRCVDRARTTTSNSVSRSSPSTSGAAKSGRTRSTHENHRYRNQTRRFLAGAAALHGDHHRGVRPDPLRPHQRRTPPSSAMPAVCGPASSSVPPVSRSARCPRCELVDGGQRVRVDFNVDRSLPLYQSTTAQIRYQDLIGNRYLELAARRR